MNYPPQSQTSPPPICFSTVSTLLLHISVWCLFLRLRIVHEAFFFLRVCMFTAEDILCMVSTGYECCPTWISCHVRCLCDVPRATVTQFPALVSASVLHSSDWRISHCKCSMSFHFIFWWRGADTFCISDATHENAFRWMAVAETNVLWKYMARMTADQDHCSFNNLIFSGFNLVFHIHLVLVIF